LGAIGKVLYFEDIINFVNSVAVKARPSAGIPSPWPLSNEDWEAMTEEQQTTFRIEFDAMLCKLGRHDYEYVKATDDGRYILKCFYCLAKKNTNGGN
jgi:hypothetical protein